MLLKSENKSTNIHYKIVEENVEENTSFSAELDHFDLSVIQTLSVNELILNIYKYLHTIEGVCYKLKYIGGKLDCNNCKVCVVDGFKPVCFDPSYMLVPNNCVVLSFGVGYDATFDVAISKYGCQIHSVDFTVANKTDMVFGRNSYYTSIGLGNVNKMNLIMNFSSIEDGAWHTKVSSIMTYETFLSFFDLTNKTIDYLKLDIENEEWTVFEQILATRPSILDNVKQLCIEVHLEDILKATRNAEIQKLEKILNVLSSLHENGFRLSKWIVNEQSQTIINYNGLKFSAFQEILLLKY